MTLKKNNFQNQFFEYNKEPESEPSYKNVGWTLGNDCPLKCKQCYSRIIRNKGQNLTKEIVDKVINQLIKISVETVNLGGNEPIYTNGLDISKSLLPYIIDKLYEKNIAIGITTAGITLTQLEKHFPESLKKINDVDISIDSPIADEHDKNRGVSEIFNLAIESLDICKKYNISRSLIMCGMKWNFNKTRLIKLIDLAKKCDANLRINPIKPIEPSHLKLVLSPKQFFDGLNVILNRCDPIDLSDPAWAVAGNIPSVSGCPCGTTSFRINAINSEGKIPLSPCVYLHDYMVGDLLKDDIQNILETPQFKTFRRRKSNPQLINGCKGCLYIKVCGGGCASRAYLNLNKFHGDKKVEKSLFVQDPYCPKKILESKIAKEIHELVKPNHKLVHQGYLCTGIFKPKNEG